MSCQARLHPYAAVLAGALVALALAAPMAPARPVEGFFGSDASQNVCEMWRDTHGVRIARPCEERVPASRGIGAPSRAASPSNTVPDMATDPGFDWGAAAIGAGAALVLMVLAAIAAVALNGRARIRTAR
jgi:hypothetical protein